MATRVATPIPGWVQWAPWTDRKGRFDGLRSVVLAVLLAPAAWLALRFGLHMMGARPLSAAIHSTGYWAVIWLVASLTITPVKSIFGLPGVVVLRRLIGNAALAYAVLHVALYCADQNWRLVTIVGEILQRFYLTIGLIALIGMTVLGATSTDEAIRRMGPRWKRLHKLVYGLAALALIHFLLQTKADVSLPLLFVGMFLWLIIWRTLPVGRDRSLPGLLIATIGAAVLTLAAEWLWYRFGTHVDPSKVVLAETDVTFGLGPGDQVALAGLCVLVATWLRRMSMGPRGASPVFWVVLFAVGAGLDELFVFAFGIDRLLDPGDWSALYQDLGWATLFGVLGYVHWRCRATGAAMMVDALALCCIAFQVMVSVGSMRATETVAAVALALFWATLAWRTRRETKLVAFSLVPLGLVMAYGLATQM